MTDTALIERITRSLAFMLRHQPETFDLELDAHGFADLGDVVQALNERLGEPVEEGDVREAVSAGDRPRYEIQEDRIRALYGHSIPVEPGPASKPPEYLFVAVPEQELERARRFGLRGGRRRFLHLATTQSDAAESGRRASRDYTVLVVHALDAWEEGISFYDRKALWLAEEVPTNLIEVEGTYHDGTEPEPRRFDAPREHGGRERERGHERQGRARGRGRGRGRGGERHHEYREARGGPERSGSERSSSERSSSERSSSERSSSERSSSERGHGGPEQEYERTGAGASAAPADEGGRRQSGGFGREGGRDNERGPRERERGPGQPAVARERAPQPGESRPEGRREERRFERPDAREAEQREPRRDDARRAGRDDHRSEPREPRREPAESAPRAPASGGGFGAGIEAREERREREERRPPPPPPRPPPRQENPPAGGPGFGAGL